MDILEMTDLEIYELGIKELIEQIGPAYTDRFLRQCKPSEYDYTAERHKWLANQPDIPTIAKRIQKREAEREAEEHIKTERIAAWRKGLLELTDPENNKRIKVDYALRHEGRPLILVECKRWRENIEESEEHHEQLAKYIFQRGVDLGILTNGKTWHFYLAYKTDVLWRDRKFCSIELNKQKEAIADFQKYLFKPNVIDESARTEAEKMVQTYAERANIQMKDRAPASDEDLEPRRIPD